MEKFFALPQWLKFWFAFTVCGHVCQLASMASGLAGAPEGATEAMQVSTRIPKIKSNLKFQKFSGHR